jgi:Holliday junction resolvasome RuvABC DNA-binding subunit
MGGSHDESNLLTLCEGHHVAVHRRKLIIKGTAPDVTFEFATLEQPANRFAIESRAVDTQRALEQLGFKRHEAAAAVQAARTHVGTSDQPIEVWLKAALEQCRDLAKRA